MLDHALSLEGPGNLVSSAIDLVGETYASDVAKSRSLLEKVLVPDRLAAHAANEVPALCQKIGIIARIDPEFGVRIFRETFSFDMVDERETSIVDSQILSLRSNARQDYGLARYALEEFVGEFLDLHPHHAIDAIVQSVEARVEKDNASKPELFEAEIQVHGGSVRLREDQSHIWAHDPESDYSDDAKALIKILLEHFRSADANAAVRMAERLIATSSLAVFWSRLFLAASERKDMLLDICLPIAMQQEFLTLPDTVKDAVDVIAKGYKSLSPSEREAFEASVSQFDFSRSSRPDDARVSIERRLFGAIGEANLSTEHAISVVRGSGSGENTGNERPFVIEWGQCIMEPYYWIEGLDRDSPANQKLIEAINRVEGALHLKSDASNAIAVTLEDCLSEMEALVSDIDREAQNSSLIVQAEGQISKCICRLIDCNQVPGIDDDATTLRLKNLLLVATNSEGPMLHEDTEKNFEDSAVWGSPAPRVDAAKAVLELSRRRSDLYDYLEPKIEDLLRDPHPAVRLEAALHLVSIWDINRAEYWQFLFDRLANEFNLGVINYLCSNVLRRTVHADPERTEQSVLALLGRFEHEPERHASVQKSVSGLIAILWATHERSSSQEVLQGWIDDPVPHVSELSRVLATLRKAFVAGLSGSIEPKDSSLRHRSQAIATDIVAVTNAEIESQLQIHQPSIEQQENYGKSVRLLDEACRQLYFAAKDIRNDVSSEAAHGGNGLEVFIEEISGTLKSIGDFAVPRTVHYLLQLCELVLPVNPPRALDLTMHAIRFGGKHAGYQFEPLGVALLVKLVGQFLADHNELFEDEDQRNALIECLEIFMDAGWPEAQRLLYRLPEMIQ